jgi:hypothetical protein
VRKLSAGDVCRLLVDIGGAVDDNGVPNPSQIPAGSEVRVRELVAAETPGAHTDEEDGVVFEYDRKHAILDENDKPQVLIQPQAFSVGVGDLDSTIERV